MLRAFPRSESRAIGSMSTAMSLIAVATTDAVQERTHPNSQSQYPYGRPVVRFDALRGHGSRAPRVSRARSARGKFSQVPMGDGPLPPNELLITTALLRTSAAFTCSRTPKNAAASFCSPCTGLHPSSQVPQKSGKALRATWFQLLGTQLTGGMVNPVDTFTFRISTQPNFFATSRTSPVRLLSVDDRRGAFMEYRLHIFDASGLMKATKIFDADSHSAAISVAIGLAKKAINCRTELWSEGRVVMRRSFPEARDNV